MRPSKPNWISDLAGVGVLAKRVFSPAYKHGVGKKLCLLWALWWSMHSWDMCLHWLWHMSLLSALETWGERGKIILESVYSCAHAKLLPPQNLYHQKKKNDALTSIWTTFLNIFKVEWGEGELLLGVLKAFLEIPYIPQMLQTLRGKLEAEWTGRKSRTAWLRRLCLGEYLSWHNQKVNRGSLGRGYHKPRYKGRKK